MQIRNFHGILFSCVFHRRVIPVKGINKLGLMSHQKIQQQENRTFHAFYEFIFILCKNNELLNEKNFDKGEFINYLI